MTLKRHGFNKKINFRCKSLDLWNLGLVLCCVWLTPICIRCYFAIKVFLNKPESVENLKKIFSEEAVDVAYIFSRTLTDWQYQINTCYLCQYLTEKFPVPLIFKIDIGTLKEYGY